MKYITKSHLLGFLIITIFGITGFTIWSSVKSKNIDRVTIENKTNSLSIESIKDLGELNENSLIEVTLKNNSTKDIVSLRFLKIGEFDNKGEVSATQQGGLELDWSLKPNETFKQKISIDSVGKVKVIIAAVLFVDGLGDGIRDDILRLQENRIGVYLAYKKIAPMFERVVNSDNDFVSDEILQNLKKDIKELNDDDVPANSKGGFQLVKGYFKIEIEDTRNYKIQDSQYNVKTKIKDKLSKMKTKLAKFSANESFNKKDEKKGGQDEN